jgi:hypothetical protein
MIFSRYRNHEPRSTGTSDFGSKANSAAIYQELVLPGLDQFNPPRLHLPHIQSRLQWQLSNSSCRTSTEDSSICKTTLPPTAPSFVQISSLRQSMGRSLRKSFVLLYFALLFLYLFQLLSSSMFPFLSHFLTIMTSRETSQNQFFGLLFVHIFPHRLSWYFITVPYSLSLVHDSWLFRSTTELTSQFDPLFSIIDALSLYNLDSCLCSGVFLPLFLLHPMMIKSFWSSTSRDENTETTTSFWLLQSFFGWFFCWETKLCIHWQRENFNSSRLKKDDCLLLLNTVLFLDRCYKVCRHL